MGLFRRDRYFVVIGKIVQEYRDTSLVVCHASVTLYARNHDDAERQASKEFLIGSPLVPVRWFRVEEVREIRRR